MLRERGFPGLTLERVAEVAGRARSTLWRQGLTRDALVQALVGALAADFRETMYPILTSAGTGRDVCSADSRRCAISSTATCR